MASTPNNTLNISMTKKYISKHRNKKNSKYWDAVLDRYPDLTIEEISSGDSGVWSNDVDVKILINIKGDWNSALTHEMLHLYLNCLKINPCSILSQKSFDHFWIRQIFDKSDLDNTGNLMSHIKMLPLFLDLQYKEELFITNYNVREAKTSIIEDLKDAYPGLKRDEELTKNYVKWFFFQLNLIKGCLNKKIKYFDDSEILRKTDPDLFGIINNFWDKWNMINIHGGSESEAQINNIVDALYLGINDYVEAKLN
jgi:hypothetical protein